MKELKRPLGVTILAILLIINSIFAVFLAISLTSLLYHIKIDYLLNNPVIFIYLFYLIFMIPITFILAYGLFKGIDTARFFTIFLYFVSIFVSIYSRNIISMFSIFISLIIIYYLTRPHVKEYFYGIKSPIY
jgi:hypothetical protein